MDEKRIVAYCYLASLNNNESNLIDSVYVPLCKRALSIYAQMGRTAGKAIDLKEIIFQLYGLNVPIVTVKQILKKIYNSMSKNEKSSTGFELFENASSFELSQYHFASFEEEFCKEEREANALELEFEKFLAERSLVPSSVPKLFEFIDRNRLSLSGFFGCNNVPINNFEGFRYHAEFLQAISISNDDLYQTARKMFLGSIIAAYLESEISPEQRLTGKITYYFDTQLVLNALDLQGEEDTFPARELIDIIHKSGGEVRILDITLEEVESIIDEAINNFPRFALVRTIPNNSIEYACKRRNLDKTDLQIIKNNLKTEVLKSLGAQLENVIPSILKKSQKSEDFEELKMKRLKPHSALHDVQAYYYVRYKRRIVCKSFQQAKYWFVTPNSGLARFNRNKTNGLIPEIIASDSLTSILWLSHPKVLSETAGKVGISQLIAHTITSSKPNVQILTQIENNIKKYVNLNEEDYSLLVLNLANKSVDEINELHKVIEDVGSFSNKILQKVEEEKSRVKDSEIKIKQAEIQVETTKQIANSLIEDKLTLEKNQFELVKTMTEYIKEVEARNKILSEQLSQEKGEKADLSDDIKKLKQYNEVTKNIFIALSMLMLTGFYFNNSNPITKNMTLSLVVALSALGVYINKGRLLEGFRLIYSFVISAAGLWGFINIMINIWKSLSENK